MDNWKYRGLEKYSKESIVSFKSRAIHLSLIIGIFQGLLISNHFPKIAAFLIQFSPIILVFSFFIVFRHLLLQASHPDKIINLSHIFFIKKLGETTAPSYPETH